jgi:DnaJ domain
VKGASQPPRDYYAVLQVHPDADTEVIEAAYRQLMKKHHPDLAGDDPERIREHLARAKALNEAYSVLRNPEQRRQYDINRRIYGWQRPAPSTGTNPTPPTSTPTPPPSGAPRPDAAAPAAEHEGTTVIVKPSSSGLPGPLAVFSAAYYLLPGPYEWEEGSRRELVTVGLLPVAGVASFAIATGRLTPWIGHSLNATLLAWGLIALLFLPMLGSLPRVAMAGAPSLLLLSGTAMPFLQQVHVPIWFAWGMASLVSVILAARLFVFGVLPTVGICWLISQIS